jgi:hypothetical protein
LERSTNCVQLSQRQINGDRFDPLFRPAFFRQWKLFAAPLLLCEHRRIQLVEFFIGDLFDRGVEIPRQDMSP